MSRNIVTFASAKGGSGKTVTAAGLGRFLASLGHSVLLVDTDAATNGLTLLFNEQVVEAKSQADLPHEGIFEVSQVGPGASLPTPVPIEGSLSLIPAAYVMQQTDGVEVPRFKRALERTLRGYRDDYDFIILDAQAGTDAYALNTVAQADQIVIVSEYDPVSAEGIERLRHVARDLFASDRTWILINKVLPEFARTLGDFLHIARYLPPIPWDADVVRAFARRGLAVDPKVPNTYTLAIAALAEGLLGRQVAQEVADWRSDRLAEITAPIKGRLEEIEDELRLTERALVDTEFQLEQPRRRPLENWALGAASLTALTATVTAAVSGALSGGLPLWVVAGFLGLGTVMLLAATLALWQRLAARVSSDSQRKDLAAQRLALQRRLDDLQEEAVKVRTMADAQLATLSGSPRPPATG